MSFGELESSRFRNSRLKSSVLENNWKLRDEGWMSDGQLN